MVGIDDSANAAGSGNKDDIVFLFIDINVQQFESEIREGIKAIPPVNRTDHHCHPFVGKSTAVILPKNEEDPRRSEEHGAA